MARAALGWGVRDLAAKAGINPNTVTRIETGGGVQSSNLQKMEKALEAASIEFLPENGVRLKAKQ